VDWNACAAAFLIPATRDVVGGNLVVTPDVGDCYSVDTSFGKIIGGEWALKAHCNERVYAGDREVYVLYLDKRASDSKYINCKSESKSKILFSKEESLAMSAIRENKKYATPTKLPKLVNMEMEVVNVKMEVDDVDQRDYGNLLPSFEDMILADTTLSIEVGTA